MDKRPIKSYCHVCIFDLQTAMEKLTGYDDFTFIIPMALRTQVETHDLIGFFINAVPVRRKGSNKADTKGAIREWGNEVQLAFDKTLPHGLLVRNIEGLRPHLQIMFQYINAGEVAANAKYGRLQSDMYVSEHTRLPHAKTEMFFHMSNNSIMLEYYKELFDAARMQRCAADVEEALKLIVGIK